MAGKYQLLPETPGAMQMVLRTADQAFIPFDEGNRDYQEYLEWLAEGNQPDPPSAPGLTPEKEKFK
jgi:hypothetical protein